MHRKEKRKENTPKYTTIIYAKVVGSLQVTFIHYRIFKLRKNVYYIYN